MATEYVTDEDLKAWDFLNGVTENTYQRRPKQPGGQRKPRAPRPKKERTPEQIEAAKAEAKARQARTKDATLYKRTVDQCAAVVKALEIVTVKLGYDLTSSATPEQRKHRRRGWHTFCALIQVMCGSYTVRGIDAALSVPNKPCREVLGGMFECCRGECGYTIEELRRMVK